MVRILVLFFLVTLTPFLRAQTAVGEWSDHLVYSTSVDVAVGNGEIFSSTGSSLMVYNRQFDEVKRLSKINGLSETGIAAIGWSGPTQTLIVAYTSGNIDFIAYNTITNLPDIARKNMSIDKIINKIRCLGDYCYLACNFGIAVLDISGNEVLDTWSPGVDGYYPVINDIAFGGGNVYAATDQGVFMAQANREGLSFYGNWTLMEQLPQAKATYNAAIFSGGKLYVNQKIRDGSGDKLYCIGETTSLFFNETGITFNSIDGDDNGFTLTSTEKIYSFSTDGTPLTPIITYQWGTPMAMRSVLSDGDIWIADVLNGLVKGENLSTFIPYTVGSPIITDAAQVVSTNGTTLLTGGGVNASWGNLGREFSISVKKDNSWISTVSDVHFDAMRAAIDPTDGSHFFVSTYGTGLLEYRIVGEELTTVNSYRADNSPIEAITGGNTERICGITFDKEGNLWITQPQVGSNIKMLGSDGNWVLFPNDIPYARIGDIVATSTGQKWIVLPGGNGIFVFDDNSTPGNFSDDKSKFLRVTDGDGAVFRNVFSLVEDLDGAIWVGTDNGPMVYTNPGRVFETDIRVNRPKLSRDDGTGLADYVLGTETITSIAVDGGNRKWLATKGSGTYLFSEDGLTQLKSYNENNTPLFSNQVNSVAIDGISGEIWFATAKGVISIRGEATDGKSGFNNVYAFPNPVREDFMGNLTITGLESDTQIRITDISGNLVYKTVSEGGQASWDLNTYNGKRAATGVYLVFCSSEDGSNSTVIKVLIIN